MTTRRHYTCDSQRGCPNHVMAEDHNSPAGWATVYGVPGGAHHFCSPECLRGWAVDTLPDTSVRLERLASGGAK